MRRMRFWSGAGLVFAMFVGGVGLASADAGPGKKCLVTVNREQAAGTLQVTRQVLDNGDCVCMVNTGPNSQAGSVENSITQLLKKRECGEKAGPWTVGDSGNGLSAAGGSGATLPIAGGVAAAAAAAGIAAGAGSTNDSTGG